MDHHHHQPRDLMLPPKMRVDHHHHPNTLTLSNPVQDHPLLPRMANPLVDGDFLSVVHTTEVLIMEALTIVADPGVIVVAEAVGVEEAAVASEAGPWAVNSI